VSNRFKPEKDQVAMTVGYDEERKFIKIEFFSSDEITAADLLSYMTQFVEDNIDDPDYIFVENEEIKHIIN
jgi:hypothetical protein